MGSLTTGLQARLTPRLERIFEQAGQRVAVQRHPIAADIPPADVQGGIAQLNDTSGLAQPLAATYPCLARRIPAREYSKLGSAGADLAVPLWKVLVHPDADLNTPGFSLTVYDGTLTAPLELIPLADADDLGTQRVCWRVICRAAGER